MVARGGGNGSIGNGESAAQWESSWREDVTRQLRESSEAHQRTAVINERTMGVLTEHDGRIKRLEDQPNQMRANITQYGGCSSQVFYIGLGVFNLLLGLTGTIIAIVSIFHHP